jgi:hypothetical protein
MNIIPISKNIVEPIPTSKIIFVNSLEEFEKIEFDPNTTCLAFDNFNQQFYTRERNKYGEYSIVMIYFYENFAQRIQNLEKEEFENKCRQAGLNEVKTTMAYLFFRKNKKPEEVWEYLLEHKIKDYSWDYVRNVRCKLKKQLHEII